MSFLFREINIAFFHYSITFDRFLGLFGLFLTSIPLLLFMAKRRIGIFFSVAILLIFYSLNKWEMLLNGSGYAHFLSFALFYLFFYLLSERVGKGSSLLSLSVFPFLFLLTGGPYAIAVYGATKGNCPFQLFQKEDRRRDKKVQKKENGHTPSR